MWKKYQSLPDLLYSFLDILYCFLSWTELQSDPVRQFNCTCITKWGKKKKKRDKNYSNCASAWDRKLTLIF